MDNSQLKKILRLCGILSIVVGLIILAVSLYDGDPSYIALILGALGIIDGCFLLGLSRKQ